MDPERAIYKHILVETDRSEIGARTRRQADADFCVGDCIGVDVVNKRRDVAHHVKRDRQVRRCVKSPKIDHAEVGQHVAVVDADGGANYATGACGDNHPQGDVIRHDHGAENCPQLWAVPLGG